MIIYEEIEKINKAIASIDRRLNKARTATFAEIQIYDTDESHVLTLDWDEDDSANRTLDFKVNSGNRIIDLSGDLTLSGDNQVESWDFYDGTDLHTIKAVAEPGLGGRLTFGLDETARILVLCDYGDIDVDLGLSIQSVPTFYIFNEDADEKIKINYTSLQSDSSLTLSADFLSFIMAADLASGDAFEFKSNANIELTDTDAEQAWMALYPKINQTGTANYIGFLMDVTETAAVGSADMLMALRVATADKFTVDPSGNIGIGTAELTCGSINRASGTLSLEIGGTSVIDITATVITPNQTVDLGIKMPATDSRARAYLSADQLNITNTTWTLIQLNAESYDTGNDFDSATNYEYIVPVTGYYFIAATMLWKSVVADKMYVIGIKVNGALIAQNAFHASSTSNLSNSMADCYYLTAGDDVELWCYQNSGVGTVDVNGDAGISTFMAIHLLSI